MLLEIIRKEILDHLIGLRFAISCILCLLVVTTSLFVRSIDFNQDMDDYNQNIVMDRQALEDVREPWGLEYRNNLINIKPNPMKIFVKGITNENNKVISIKGTNEAKKIVPDIKNSSVPLFPVMDLVFFIGVIMSLIAIVFGYNSISGEKENGTLRLLLSYSIPRDKLLLGKWIGGYIVLVAPLILTITAMASVFLVQKSIQFTQDEWFRFLFIIAISLIYLAAVFSMSIWISTITRKSSTSIILLVAIWVVLVLALPNISPYVSDIFSKGNSLKQINTVRSELVNDIWDAKLQNKKDRYDKENGFDKDWRETWRNSHDKKRKAFRRWKRFAEFERDAHMELLNEYEKLDNKYYNEMNNKISIGKWIARLSPFSCFSFSAIELAGEGLLERERLLEQIKRFHKEFSKYMYGEHIAREDYFLTNVGNTRKVKWSKQRKPFPVFTYKPASLLTNIKPVITDIFLLILFTIVFFMLSFLAFLKYDVR